MTGWLAKKAEGRVLALEASGEEPRRGIRRDFVAIDADDLYQGPLQRLGLQQTKHRRPVFLRCIELAEGELTDAGASQTQFVLAGRTPSRHDVLG